MEATGGTAAERLLQQGVEEANKTWRMGASLIALVAAPQKGAST
jgi:hypothetical protein